MCWFIGRWISSLIPPRSILGPGLLVCLAAPWFFITKPRFVWMSFFYHGIHHRFCTTIWENILMILSLNHPTSNFLFCWGYLWRTLGMWRHSSFSCSLHPSKSKSRWTCLNQFQPTWSNFLVFIRILGGEWSPQFFIYPAVGTFK